MRLRRWGISIGIVARGSLRLRSSSIRTDSSAPKGKTDPEGVTPGWQTQLGELEDRDIAFHDTMLATLRSELAVDPDRS